MPTLIELQNKWFLRFDPTGTPCPQIDNVVEYQRFLDGQAPFPLIRRHTSCSITTNFTNGNLLTPLIDGEAFMGQWRQSLERLTFRYTPFPEHCSMYHCGYIMNDVLLLGSDHPGVTAYGEIEAAHLQHVKMYFLLNRSAKGYEYSESAVQRLTEQNITAEPDSRFPAAGSNHFKFTVFKNPDTVEQATAILGSIDLFSHRWDNSLHVPSSPVPLILRREPGIPPTHDLGVEIRGPSVADIERVFLDRWHDSLLIDISDSAIDRERTFVRHPNLPPIQSPVSAPPAPVGGSHSIQVLLTYGITSHVPHYSWADSGEFSIWAAYLNAIRQAQIYLYIEDQYFFPFGFDYPAVQPGSLPPDAIPPYQTDLIYQLGEAIRRGVHVMALIPRATEDNEAEFQVYHRNVGVYYLATIAQGAPGSFDIAYLESELDPQTRIGVHSKLLIADDEFVLMGTANINRRSMAHDGELHLGILDENNSFAADLRRAMWSEHTQSNFAPTLDLTREITDFRSYIASSQGRLRPYPTNAPGTPPSTRWWTIIPISYQNGIDHLIDPYAGPEPD